eukprot:SM000195S05276  [mRNA]  locus=s195:117043:117935:+ [translate_table: standard]
MASDEVEEVVDEPASKDLRQQSKALDSITDHVEERQIDSSRVQQAMAAISESSEADRNAQRLKEKELASVTINPEDVDLIATELEMDRKQAERTLREHKGDAVSAVRSMLQ